MENVYPNFARVVYKEIRDILAEDIDGINLILNEQDVSDIQAFIDGPKDTPFEGGRFHIRLVLPNNYPTEPPRGYFLTKIFHPNINWRTGDICVDTLKREWKPDVGIKHILVTIRCLLIAPNPESALNEEAGRLLLEDYEDYKRQAKLMTEIHAPKFENSFSKADTIGTPNMHSTEQASILRDSNSLPIKKTVMIKPNKKISAAKKAIKRL